MTDLVVLNLTSNTFEWAQWSLIMDIMQLELQKLFGGNRSTHDGLGGVGALDLKRDLTSKTFRWAQWSLVMDLMQLELQEIFGGN